MIKQKFLIVILQLLSCIFYPFSDIPIKYAFQSFMISAFWSGFILRSEAINFVEIQRFSSAAKTFYFALFVNAVASFCLVRLFVAYFSAWTDALKGIFSPIFSSPVPAFLYLRKSKLHFAISCFF